MLQGDCYNKGKQGHVSRGVGVLGLLILEHLQGDPLTLNTKHSPVPKKPSLPPNLFLSLQSVDR